MKKMLIILLSLMLLITVVGCGSDEVPEKKAIKEVEEISEEDQEYWDSVKENIVGNSNKDFSDITTAIPSDVRGDTTGKLKNIVISNAIGMEEYAMSYYRTNMEDSEIHYIIDFGRNTTSSIRSSGGIIYVDTMEYQKKEEHDAKQIGTGLLLKQYKIYPDGDIEELK